MKYNEDNKTNEKIEWFFNKVNIEYFEGYLFLSMIVLLISFLALKVYALIPINLLRGIIIEIVNVIILILELIIFHAEKKELDKRKYKSVGFGETE